MARALSVAGMVLREKGRAEGPRHPDNGDGATCRQDYHESCPRPAADASSSHSVSSATRRSGIVPAADVAPCPFMRGLGGWLPCQFSCRVAPV